MTPPNNIAVHDDENVGLLGAAIPVTTMAKEDIKEEPMEF